MILDGINGKFTVYELEKTHFLELTDGEKAQYKSRLDERIRKNFKNRVFWISFLLVDLMLLLDIGLSTVDKVPFIVSGIILLVIVVSDYFVFSNYKKLCKTYEKPEVYYLEFEALSAPELVKVKKLSINSGQYRIKAKILGDDFETKLYLSPQNAEIVADYMNTGSDTDGEKMKFREIYCKVSEGNYIMPYIGDYSKKLAKINIVD